MKDVLTKLRAPVALAALWATMLAPTAWADGSAATTDITITAASGVSNVNVSGPGISGTQLAVSCSAVPGGWGNPLAGTHWISSVADCTATPSGDFVYSVAFSLPADLSNVQNPRVDGQVMVDDTVTVQLNGHNVFSGGSSSAATAFTVTERSWFNAGANSLTFLVHNGPAASALDFTATVGAHSTVPVVSGDRDDDDDRDGDHDGDGSHGACVSAVAHSAPHGRGHGEAVRKAAHDCD